MATAIRSGAITESPAEPGAWPTFEEGRPHGAPRAVAAARHATESLAAETVVRVRSHPLRAVGLAMAAGALVGACVGFGIGRLARNCRRL
ncbi:MAG: hypothetical protein HY657_16170 [Acidobacteria bacterium]|nr:hypothetical protein [Acidobacteriota bacterium]